jgi:hypothetical protein
MLSPPPPALTPLKPCYVAVDKRRSGTEPVTVGGTGFTPDSAVDVALDGDTLITGAKVDGAGTLPAGTIPAPFVAKGRKRFEITVTEQGSERSASASALVARLGVRITPGITSPTHVVRFRGRGFTDDAPVFVHYLRKGELRRTVRLAKDPGTCGSFSVRRREFPFVPRTGRWRLQFDQQKVYAKAPEGQVADLRITVRRR